MTHLERAKVPPPKVDPAGFLPFEGRWAGTESSTSRRKIIGLHGCCWETFYMFDLIVV